MAKHYRKVAKYTKVLNLLGVLIKGMIHAENKTIFEAVILQNVSSLSYAEN